MPTSALQNVRADFSSNQAQISLSPGAGIFIIADAITWCYLVLLGATLSNKSQAANIAKKNKLLSK
jgi:hypothetical protein